MDLHSYLKMMLAFPDAEKVKIPVEVAPFPKSLFLKIYPIFGTFLSAYENFL